MPWPKTGATLYHAKTGFPDKGGAIKELAVCRTFCYVPHEYHYHLLGCPCGLSVCLIISLFYCKTISTIVFVTCSLAVNMLQNIKFLNKNFDPCHNIYPRINSMNGKFQGKSNNEG